MQFERKMNQILKSHNALKIYFILFHNSTYSILYNTQNFCWKTVSSTQDVYLDIYWQPWPGGEWALAMEVGTGMCQGIDPLFSGQSALPSHKFPFNVLLVCSPFSIFRKLCISSLVFGQSLSSQNANFSNVRPQDPLFLKTIRSLDLTFGNPCGTYQPKRT